MKMHEVVDSIVSRVMSQYANKARWVRRHGDTGDLRLDFREIAKVAARFGFIEGRKRRKEPSHGT